MAGFDFINAKPLDSTYKIEGINLYGLGIYGKDYMMYWIKTGKNSPVTWNFPLPVGNYMLRWMDPSNGRITHKEVIQVEQYYFTIKIPAFHKSQILHIKRLQ